MESARKSIVGRELELDLLDAFVGGEGGGAVFAVIEGEAGIGKTALWSAAADVARRRGVRVLEARPTAAEAGSSYVALDDLVRPALDVLPCVEEPRRGALAGALLLEEAGGPTEPRLVALGLLSLVEELAREAPVLVAVDDWQWLDGSSAAMLAFVVRRLAPDGVRVLATARTGEADDALAVLVRSLAEGRALEIPVGPLERAALQRLLHDRTGTWLSPPALRRLHAASRGNPLAALELARANADVAPATDVRRLLAARMARLSRDAREVLRCVAALVGPRAGAVEAASDDPVAARRGLEEALAAQVLERNGERLRFAHPLMAAVTEERTPPGHWRALHQRLAGTVRDPEQRARHLALAASGPDADVAAALETAAARATARGAPATAAELAERAGTLTPAGEPEERARRLLDAADLHTLAGDYRRACALLEGLVEALPPGPLRARALQRLAYLDTEGARNRERAERALAEAGDDDHLLAEIHLTIANNELLSAEPDVAAVHAEAAAKHARRAGDPYLQARALTELAGQHCWRGQGVQRDALLEADRLARQGGGRSVEYTPLSMLGLQQYWAGELTEGRRVLEEELRRAQREGNVEHEGFAQAMLVDLEVRAGRLTVADAHAQQALDRGLGMAMSNSETGARTLRARVDALLGRVESAREHATRAVALAGRTHDAADDILARHVLGFLELSLGDAEAAVGWLADLPARVEAIGAREPMMFGVDPDLAEALVLVGDLDGARAVQARLDALGHELGRPWAIATALRCRGVIAAAEGRHDAAIADHRTALEVLERVGQPFERARTLLALGTAERRAKQRAAARTSLQGALALFAELGTELWAQRARAEITRLGGRRAAGRDELTPTEQRVAELAADGRSNREIAAELFVSERTVEANLTRVYRKLGIRSRTQLARHMPAA
jgi:DNA-binding CsgD family transcriptional regulator